MPLDFNRGKGFFDLPVGANHEGRTDNPHEFPAHKLLFLVYPVGFGYGFIGINQEIKPQTVFFYKFLMRFFIIKTHPQNNGIFLF